MIEKQSRSAEQLVTGRVHKMLINARMLGYIVEVSLTVCVGLVGKLHVLVVACAISVANITMHGDVLCTYQQVCQLWQYSREGDHDGWCLGQQMIKPTEIL